MSAIRAELAMRPCFPSAFSCSLTKGSPGNFMFHSSEVTGKISLKMCFFFHPTLFIKIISLKKPLVTGNAVFSLWKVMRMGESNHLFLIISWGWHCEVASEADVCKTGITHGHPYESRFPLCWSISLLMCMENNRRWTKCRPRGSPEWNSNFWLPSGK